METKKVFGFVVAILAVLFMASFAVAEVTDSNVIIDDVAVNDVSASNDYVTSLAVSPGETIPVVVKFTVLEDLSDLKLKAWIDGYRSDVYASTSTFDVRTDSDTNESTYVKRLSLTLPSVDDMESNVDEGLTLHVRIADKTGETEVTYRIDLQKDANSIGVLSAEVPSKAAAGEIIALDVVLENNGANTVDNAFVTVTIPELGASRRVFFGDIYAQDNSGDNEDNTQERRVYLTIPTDAKSGDYEMQIKASDYDTTTTVKKVITITGSAVSDDSTAITPAKTGKISTSVVVLTAVLVVVFVVLLIVLIVLLTKKPTDKIEDFSESYY